MAAGDDTVEGIVAHGGPGNDRLYGGRAADQLYGGAGYDYCNGQRGWGRDHGCNTGPRR